MQLKTRWQRMKTAFMELYPRLRTTLIVLGGILVGITMFALLVWVSRAVNWPAWTGFNTYTKPDTIDEREKTLWDWLDLLIVPAVLAGGAYLFNRAERRNESQIAEQRARDATLQAYLDQMTTLLLEKELRKSKPDTEIREVARIRTLTALRRLDADVLHRIRDDLWSNQLLDGVE